MEEYLKYKILLLGYSEAKSFIINKLKSNAYKEKNKSSKIIEEVSFKGNFYSEERDTKVPKKVVDLIISNTPGQENYNSITNTYFRDSDAAIILYDITDKSSFNDLNKWIEKINNCVKIGDNEYVVFLMGAKIKIIKSRDVKEQEAIEKCQEKQIEWGGEFNNGYSKEQLKKKFIEFAKILYKKIGVKNIKQKRIKLDSFTKKKRQCCL